MKFTVLGSGAGLPSKSRNTQSYILDLVDEINEYFLIDAGEAIQHRMLHTNIKPQKVSNVFITHLHGDHIYGLLGFLASRAHQGGDDKPLSIYGPKGVEEWVETSLKITHSYLNYPVEYIEVKHGDAYDVSGFTVSVYKLEHTVDSFLYVFKEPDKKGQLDTGKLDSIGIEPGPMYKAIKESDEFEYQGILYQTRDFVGPDIRGRKVSVHGDSRIIKDEKYYPLVDNSDLIVHESTYLLHEQKKAHQYFHSELNDVLQNLSQINYGQLLLSHISNRYIDDDIIGIRESLPENVTVAHDLVELTIPRSSR